MITAGLEQYPDTLGDRDWVGAFGEIGTRFASRAAETDRRGEFVDENYRDLRERGFFWMAIPKELGGGGASYSEVCGIIRQLGGACGSTALAFSMHTHPVALNVFKHLRGDERATRTLRRIASERLVIAGTGANDWLESSGLALRAEGGFRVTARKRFVSGAPGSQIFVTSARYDGEMGPEVLHFSVPFSRDGVRIIETWDALGMRGTGSHDVDLEDVFVEDEAIVARRPAGVWHPMWDSVLPVAMPLIASVYLGLADSAVAFGREAAAGKGAALASAVGEMMSFFTMAEVAVDDMVRLNADYGFSPGLVTTNAMLTRKAIATDALKKTVELAAELVGGPGFMRGHPVERALRDVRAMHFHPLPAPRQREFSGRVAMGLDPVG